jgi:hypothetical protein
VSSINNNTIVTQTPPKCAGQSISIMLVAVSRATHLSAALQLLSQKVFTAVIIMIQTQHQKNNTFRLVVGGTPERDQILDVNHSGHLWGVTTGGGKENLGRAGVLVERVLWS